MKKKCRFAICLAAVLTLTTVPVWAMARGDDPAAATYAAYNASANAERFAAILDVELVRNDNTATCHVNDVQADALWYRAIYAPTGTETLVINLTAKGGLDGMQAAELNVSADLLAKANEAGKDVFVTTGVGMDAVEEWGIRANLVKLPLTDASVYNVCFDANGNIDSIVSDKEEPSSNSIAVYPKEQ